MQDPSATMASSEFLAFTMGQEEYGLDIIKVQEIRGYEAVTRPDWLTPQNI
jgi:purine-binding chemotaxis protein CheW